MSAVEEAQRAQPVVSRWARIRGLLSAERVAAAVVVLVAADVLLGLVVVALLGDPPAALADALPQPPEEIGRYLAVIALIIGAVGVPVGAIWLHSLPHKFLTERLKRRSPLWAGISIFAIVFHVAAYPTGTWWVLRDRPVDLQPIHGLGGQITDIAEGPGSSVWFTVPELGRVSQYRPRQGLVDYPLLWQKRLDRPGAIARGSRAMWVTGQDLIWRIEQDSPPKPDDLPGAHGGPIAVGDHGVWVIRRDDHDVVRYDTTQNVTVKIDMPDLAGGSPVDIANGPDETAWFTISTGTQVGEITRNDEVKLHQLPARPRDSGNAQTRQQIASDGDGNVWVSDYGRLIRLTADGSMTIVPLFPTSDPQGLTADISGGLWLTDVARRAGRSVAAYIGHVNTHAPLREFPFYQPLAVDSQPTAVAATPDVAYFVSRNRGVESVRLDTRAGTLADDPMRQRLDEVMTEWKAARVRSTGIDPAQVPKLLDILGEWTQPSGARDVLRTLHSAADEYVDLASTLGRLPSQRSAGDIVLAWQRLIVEVNRLATMLGLPRMTPP